MRLIRRRSSRRSTRKRPSDTTRDEAETSNSKSGSKVTFRESQVCLLATTGLRLIFIVHGPVVMRVSFNSEGEPNSTKCVS